MPKLSALFDSFDNLDQIPVENIASWLKPSPQLIQLENYIANKILYPHALPLTEFEMRIDLAIIREALKINGPTLDNKNTNSLLGENPFLNITLRKVLIPQTFLQFVPDLISLTWAFIDGLLVDRKKEDWFEDLWTIVLTDDTDEIVGSIILPQFERKGGEMQIEVLGKTYQIQAGSLTMIPCPKDRCEISYKLQKGKILGKIEAALEIYGGRLGLMIDARNL